MGTRSKSNCGVPMYLLVHTKGGSCDEGSHLARRNRRSRGYRPGSPVGGADGRHHRGAVDQHLSDLHLYEILGAFMKVGDVLGYEPRESFVRLGPPSPTSLSTTESSFRFKSLAAVATCVISSSTQCETTQVRASVSGRVSRAASRFRKPAPLTLAISPAPRFAAVAPGLHQAIGAALFGYSELYSQVPGGQAELLRVPQAQITHMKVPEGPPVVWPMPDRARRRSSSR